MTRWWGSRGGEVTGEVGERDPGWNEVLRARGKVVKLAR
jgi:hypothetical protein